MALNLYEGLAGAALVVHLVWIIWVIFGALVTRNRPLLASFHIVSLLYSIVIEVGPWPCPLTVAEQWFQAKAGLTPYERSFLVHHLEALIYPELLQRYLPWCATAVCLFILGIYGMRFRRKGSG